MSEHGHSHDHANGHAHGRAHGHAPSSFNRAFATIVDSNVTMLIAAVILFLLGSGPVKGFAITLALGILTTIFTAVTMTRLMIALWYRYQRPTHLPI